MSDEEDIANDATPPASPSWMQSQQPKQNVVSAEPKAKRPRRTRAQMAEAKAASVTIARTDGNSGPPPIAGYLVSSVDDHTVRLAPEPHPLAYPTLSWWARNGVLTQHVPLAVGVLALIVAIFAIAR